MNIKLIQDGLTGRYKKPNIFLCEVDKTRICKLETTNTKATFKFNSYSEISFEVARVYNDIITGETRVFPFYDKIEALRLIYVEDIGYFEIQGPSISGDGIKEVKSVTAYSLEYTLSQKYLEDLYNDGTVGSIEAGYIDEEYDDGKLPKDAEYPVVTLYNADPRLSLTDIILEKAYGWSFKHIDDSLKTKSRQFNIERTSIYDFIMNDICEMFNCYAVFNTINNTINLYAEALTETFPNCDGNTKQFTLKAPFQAVKTVSDDGYKIFIDGNQNKYDPITGTLTLANAPAAGHTLEVISEDMTPWETDVFVSFDNLSQEVNVDYSADDIKTVLTVEYGEGQSVRETNLGLPYITDLSYYYSVDWMGQELYDVYTEYNTACEAKKADYIGYVQDRLDWAVKLGYEENRVSLDYSIADNVTDKTVTNEKEGKVYYIRKGDSPNYYYEEKKLPAEYEIGQTYYTLSGANLTEAKIISFRKALGHYFRENSMEKFDELVKAQTFVFTNKSEYKGLHFGDDTYDEKTLLGILNKYKDCGAFIPLPPDKEEDDRKPEDKYTDMQVDTPEAKERDKAIKQFLGEILDQFGTNMLNVLKDMYVQAQDGFIAGWKKASDAIKEETSTDKDKDKDKDDEMTKEEVDAVKNEIKNSAQDYPSYYPVVLILEVIEQELGVSIHAEPPASKSTGRYADYYKNNIKQPGIDTIKTKINELTQLCAEITESLVMNTWFFNYYYEPLVDEFKMVNGKDDDYELTSEENTPLKNQASASAAALMARLSPFLREDELVLDDIVSTELDTTTESLKVQEDALSAGYIELQKLSQPQLNFAMTMANIYALPEFAPIVQQFQLGNLIKVAIRPGYIKQARLMQVDMGLDDFSDFSCEFGELTNLSTQSDIHADLLSQAASAGKQVATNSSYWTKGSDKATSLDSRLEQGLLDATTAIKSIDATQDIVIDKYGIKLQKKDPESGAIDPHQARFVNNMLLFTKDGWKTSSTGLGDFTVAGRQFYGLLAEAVVSGYVYGSDIEGGTLRVGQYKDNNGKEQWSLSVDEDGTVSIMDYIHFYRENGKWTNTLEDTINELQKKITIINQTKMYRIEVETLDSQIFNNKDQMATLTAHVYSWDDDITDTLPDKDFIWFRTSSDPDSDKNWTRTGKTIIIKADDVLNNASFSCQVQNLPDAEKEGE